MAEILFDFPKKNPPIFLAINYGMVHKEPIHTCVPQ